MQECKYQARRQDQSADQDSAGSQNAANDKHRGTQRPHPVQSHQDEQIDQPSEEARAESGDAISEGRLLDSKDLMANHAALSHT